MKGLQSRNRRKLLQAGSAMPLMLLAGGTGVSGFSRSAWAGNNLVRFGMTPAFLHDQYSLLEDWRIYMSKQLGKKTDFIQRDSYRETMDLLRLNQLDFAWVCDYPYLHLRHLLRLLAVPLYKQKPVYHSYLIVNAKDKQTQGLEDLQDRIFAYADPYSNTGYLVPRYQIYKMGQDPERYFKKSFFTWSHRKVVEAVASGLAQGGAVDSFVWDTLTMLEPALTSRTRVVWQSNGFGFPPMVAHIYSVDESDFSEMQQMLLAMPENPEGKALLKRLNLDGFSVQSPTLYDNVAEMMQVFGEYNPT